MSKQVIIKWNPIKIWPFPIKSDSLRCYLPLRIISMQKKNKKKNKIHLPGDTGDQRTLQYDWTRDATDQTKLKAVVSFP